MYKPVEMTDLVLLVGTNPLPNYVSAKFLLQKEEKLQRIWLVHSEKNKNQEATEDYALRLQNIIQKELPPSRNIEFVKNNLAINDVGNAQSIEKTIKNNILSKISLNHHIHLNYTGGTKAMGTHSYRTIENFCKEKDRDCSFSYLDARSFKIVFDNNDNSSDDLRTLIFPEFEDLITLHGFHRINKDSESKFGALLNQFEELIKSKKIRDFYNSSPNINGYNRDLFLNKKGELANKLDTTLKSQNNGSSDEKAPSESNSKISLENLENLKKSTVNETVQSVFNLFPPEKQIYKNGEFNHNLNGTINIEEELKFIDGKWFEEYIFNQLKNKLEIHNIKILKNWVIKKENKNSYKDFELDILLLRGYQLIGISCTTSPKSYICKSKGFEIIHRVKQIGGSESKAILITFMNSDDYNQNNNVSRLENELILDTGSSKNIKVFGLPDILSGELCQKIINFLEMEEN